MLIDTHCHIELLVEFQNPALFSHIKLLDVIKEIEADQTGDLLFWQHYAIETQRIVDEAKARGVNYLITVGNSWESSMLGFRVAERFEEAFCTLGIHPCEGSQNWRDEMQSLRDRAAKLPAGRLVGIGETGFDFYHAGEHKQYQKDLFVAHIELALELGLPLVIHTRDAFDETMTVLESYKQRGIRGVVHCFSEDVFGARRVLDLGFLLGIGGPVTYPKNDTLREVVQLVGLEQIVLETDAPFLPPQSIRGKRNHPREVATIAAYLSDLLKRDVTEIARQTTENACRLFSLPIKH